MSLDRDLVEIRPEALDTVATGLRGLRPFRHFHWPGYCTCYVIGTVQVYKCTCVLGGPLVPAFTMTSVLRHTRGVQMSTDTNYHFLLFLFTSQYEHVPSSYQSMPSAATCRLRFSWDFFPPLRLMHPTRRPFRTSLLSIHQPRTIAGNADRLSRKIHLKNITCQHVPFKKSDLRQVRRS